MTNAPLALVELDVQISRIQLLPESTLPASIHSRTSPSWSK
jgi:hypothetical protein